jgi:hypothetical protein
MISQMCLAFQPHAGKTVWIFETEPPLCLLPFLLYSLLRTLFILCSVLLPPSQG